LRIMRNTSLGHCRNGTRGDGDARLFQAVALNDFGEREKPLFDERGVRTHKERFAAIENAGPIPSHVQRSPPPLARGLLALCERRSGRYFPASSLFAPVRRSPAITCVRSSLSVSGPAWR
jgi:hypothetical protein